MEACNNGIHDVNAAKLGITKTLAKNAFYGWSYLAGARTLHFTFKGKGIHVPIARCQELLDSFDREYRIAAGFRAATIELARNHRYVENGFGLRRYFPQLTFPAPAAMATHIQSSGAMMMWHTLKQHQDAARGLGGDILLMVHDDVLWEVPIEAEAQAVQALTDIMTQPFDQVAPGFRCPITPKSSRSSWGELTPWTVSA
jgi:DNA polymerase-1